ncbi:NAD-dependent epimerase/dehydratase family protein, partial [bacterium]|nr:NAD-dependent epimerase/dehydratase family protein [bacterium]
FIFASTGGAIYGEQENFPASETHPVNPISPYGVAKLAVEKYMYFYHNQYGMHTIVLRYGNVYGPRQNPLGEAGVIAIFCHNMLAGDQPYINGDGLQTRDYVFVDDVVRANIAALELDGLHVINIGTGIETDVVTLFDKLNELTGGSFERKHRPGGEGEQRRSIIDSTLAGKILGWSPGVDLTEGLQKTVNFFKARVVTTQNE